MNRRRITASLCTLVLLGASLSAGALACSSSDDGGGGPSGTGGVATGGGGGTVTGGSGGAVTGGSGGTLTGGTAGVAGSAGSGAAAGAGGIAANYPPGPYGNNKGDTIADLKWEGYVNETGDVRSDSKPYIDYGTDAMRKSGKRYGLIHISAFT